MNIVWGKLGQADVNIFFTCMFGQPLSPGDGFFSVNLPMWFPDDQSKILDCTFSNIINISRGMTEVVNVIT